MAYGTGSIIAAALAGAGAGWGAGTVQGAKMEYDAAKSGYEGELQGTMLDYKLAKEEKLTNLKVEADKSIATGHDTTSRENRIAEEAGRTTRHIEDVGLRKDELASADKWREQGFGVQRAELEIHAREANANAAYRSEMLKSKDSAFQTAGDGTLLLVSKGRDGSVTSAVVPGPDGKPVKMGKNMTMAEDAVLRQGLIGLHDVVKAMNPTEPDKVMEAKTPEFQAAQRRRMTVFVDSLAPLVPDLAQSWREIYKLGPASGGTSPAPAAKPGVVGAAQTNADKWLGSRFIKN